MAGTLILELDKSLSDQLDRHAIATGLTREAAALDLLRRRLFVSGWDRLTAEIEPHARRAGYKSDEDVFRDVS